MKATFFANQQEFRSWLEEHHQQATELIVGFYKVGTGKASLTWSQSVDQALCFGWIDGVRRSIDAESYCIRFTPRKPKSIWSLINIRKIEELRAAGLMTEAGEKAYSYKTESSSALYLHLKEPKPLLTDYEQAFKANVAAWEFFSKQAPSYKRVMIHWIMSAKQEKTQLARLEKTIAESAKRKRVQ